VGALRGAPTRRNLKWPTVLHPEELDMAAPEYEKYLEQYLNAPGRQTALFRLGECYRTMGNINGARTATRRLSPVLRPASLLARLHFAWPIFSSRTAI